MPTVAAQDAISGCGEGYLGAAFQRYLFERAGSDRFHRKREAYWTNATHTRCHELQVESLWHIVAAAYRRASPPNDFLPASRYDIVVSDETPFPAVNRSERVSELNPWAEELKRAHPTLGKLSVLVSLDLIFDIGGDSRLFPYVEWSHVKPGDSDSLMLLAKQVEETAQTAAHGAIQVHKSQGRAVHFMDERDVPSGNRPMDGECKSGLLRMAKR